jgi:hypothetical protein
MAYDDPHLNYLRLKDTVQYLQAGGLTTESWFCEHTAYILKYNEIFWDLCGVNTDVEDSEFRKLAEESGLLLQNLIESIVQDEWFNVNYYLKLNINLIKMSDILQLGEDLDNAVLALSIH